jgi:hypothetical protein
VIDGKNGLVLSDISSLANIAKVQQFLLDLPAQQSAIETFSARNAQIFNVEKLASEMLSGFRLLSKS